MDDFFKFLNKESSDVTLIKLHRKDAIGIMANKINQNITRAKDIILDDIKFMQKVKSIVYEIKEGHLSQRLDYNPKSSNLLDLKTEVNEMLEVLNKTIGGNINDIKNVLKSYSNLNFKRTIKNEQGEVEKNILNVGDIITKMLIENKRNGLTIDESENVLLENFDILNTSSNEAAAPEQTAAALEEMIGSIANNTENILRMSSHTKEVTNYVQTLANETTMAMEEIDEQVTAINEAIRVIDQIAFQTNILSLNAAVEATTAGEAGKGFDVVAQEVRKLASRSAEAANDIKNLVNLQH